MKYDIEVWADSRYGETNFRVAAYRTHPGTSKKGPNQGVLGLLSHHAEDLEIKISNTAGSAGHKLTPKELRNFYNTLLGLLIDPRFI